MNTWREQAEQMVQTERVRSQTIHQAIRVLTQQLAIESLTQGQKDHG